MKTTEYKLSKKLKELGVEQDSSFAWCKPGEDWIRGYLGATGRLNKISAFTLGELLEMLPASLVVEDKEYHLIIEKEPFSKEKREYNVIYEAADPYKQLASSEHENPAEAAGQLLAECIEKGYIKIM